MSQDTESQVLPTLAPRSIIFWRHIVGIAIVLLALPPRLYAHESFLYFFGQWVGSLVIIYGTAALITSLGYLFFTAKLKTRVWQWYVSSAWTIGALLLIGHWVVVPAADKIAKSAEKPTQSNRQEFPSTGTPPNGNVFDQFDTPSPDSPKRYLTTEELNALGANTQQPGRTSTDEGKKKNGQTCSLDRECSGTLFCIKRKCAPPAWQSAESHPISDERRKEKGQKCNLDSECSGTLFCIKRKCAPPAWQNSLEISHE